MFILSFSSLEIPLNRKIIPEKEIHNKITLSLVVIFVWRVITIVPKYSSSPATIELAFKFSTGFTISAVLPAAALITSVWYRRLKNLFGGLSTACDFMDLVQNGFFTPPVVPLRGSFGHRSALRPLCLGYVSIRQTGSKGLDG